MPLKIELLAANMILDNLKQKFKKVKNCQDFEALQGMDERIYEMMRYSSLAPNLVSAVMGRWRTIKLPRLNNTDKV